MKIVCCVLASSLLFVACGSTAPAPPAAPPAPAAKAYGSLAQMMQAVAFPASNVLFDAQNEEYFAKKEAAPGGASAGATAAYQNVYGGWTGVENAAIAISETANLLAIPGRMCRNGKPAPTDQDDYKKFTAQLAAAGEQALKAAQAKSVDQIVDVSGVVTEACAACHEVYRDKDDEKDRCTPPAAK